MPFEYFYNGNLRWSVYWANPNAWAALLVFVLVGLWTIQRSLSLEFKFKGLLMQAFVAYAVELGVWFLLVKTYSRGGLVAAVAGMAFFFGLRGAGRAVSPKPPHSSSTFSAVSEKPPYPPILKMAIRLALVAALCVAVGFISRFSPDHLAADKSVSNRLDMWRGALAMIYDSPFHGWGFRNGGLS